ncbi:MAG: glycosyltransferase family 2 protein [Lachnospiraceae bacterium]|nr:glycosyltransferase family 2 protein [Lachnospiraceae bacterium]
MSETIISYGGERTRNSEVLLVIPAYNEADSIERVVDELIRDYPQLDYVVVTDGPTDGTDIICQRRGYNAVHLPKNLGLAGCFHNGMRYASEMGYQYAVQFDGDGQHRPEYIDAMYKKAREGYDIVLGSRFIGLSNKMSGMRSLGSHLIRCAIRWKTGVKVTDPTCGLRMYNKRIIDMFARRTDLAPEPDTISLLIMKGAKVAEVPVRVADRETGESYLNPVNAVKYMRRMLRSILFMRTRRKTTLES